MALLEAIMPRIQYVISASKCVICEYNTNCSKLHEATVFIPGRRAPTISPLAEEGWVTVSAMVKG